MDNENKNTDLGENQDWLDEILGASTLEDEIGPDEQAVSAAGLTHPGDLELEKIVQETQQWDTVLPEDDIFAGLLTRTEEEPAVEDVPAEEASVEDTPAEEIPAQDIPVEEVPVEIIPGEESAVEQAPAEVSEEMPEEELTVEAILAEMASLEVADTQQEDAPAVMDEPTQMFTPVQAEEKAEEVPLPEPAPARPRRRRKKAAPEEKRRPEMKKGYGLFGIPHIVVTVIWIAIAIAIGTTMGRTIWLCAADLLAFNQEPHTVTLVVKDDDTIETIAQQLKDRGLIRYPDLFKFFADLTGKGEDIAPGTYTLNAPDEETGNIPGTVYDYNALLNAMKSSAPSRQTVNIMFPEGYSCAQIFALLEENGVCSVEELEEYAANGKLDEYWFLEGVERGHKYCLEGFLAPDTYQFYTNDEPGRVLDKFLYEFDDRFTDRMKEQFTQLQSRYSKKLANRGYSQSYIDEHMLTIRDVVILASIVEKETASDSESFDIASVFFNRLGNPGNYPFLNSDATLQYAIDYYSKDELTTDELKNSSPYNTYTYQGLPAGPICNPGANSLYAALNPNDTSYYYFVYDKGAYVHRFSKTLSEHQKWLKKLGL